MNVKDSADVIVQQVTIAPGAQTGWHSHHGPVVVVLQAGTMTLYQHDDPNCIGETFTVGEAFVDPGQGNVHNARNEGSVPQPWQADQAISVEQGLELMTRAGAYATFDEDRKGTVTAGKLADLVVLSDDPRSVAGGDLAGMNVLMTMVGGSIDYCSPDAGTLCSTDG